MTARALSSFQVISSQVYTLSARNFWLYIMPTRGSHNSIPTALTFTSMERELRPHQVSNSQAHTRQMIQISPLAYSPSKEPLRIGINGSSPVHQNTQASTRLQKVLHQSFPLGREASFLQSSKPSMRLSRKRRMQRGWLLTTS